MSVAPTAPATGFGWKIGVQVKPTSGSPGAYIDLPWLTKLTKPKRAIDGADASTLSGTIELETPTRPKLTSSASMWVVEGDAGYGILRDSCKQAPCQVLLCQITSPWGSTKTFECWISNWNPSDMTAKENNSIDFDLMLTTPETDAAASS